VWSSGGPGDEWDHVAPSRDDDIAGHISNSFRVEPMWAAVNLGSLALRFSNPRL
jgi:hypothetical protein